MRIAGVQVRGAAIAYVFFEDLLIIGSILGSLAYSRGGAAHLLGSPLGTANSLLMFIGIKAVFFWSGLYDLSHKPDRRTFWTRLCVAYSIVFAGTWLHWFILTDERVAAKAFLLAFISQVTIARLGFEVLSRTEGYRRRLLFLGIAEQAQRTARQVVDQNLRDYEVTGFLCEKEEEKGWRIGGRPVLGTYGDLPDVVSEHGIDRVVVALADRRQHLPLDSLLKVRLDGVEIVDQAQVHEEIAGKIPVEDLRPSWLIFSTGFKRSFFRRYTKRLFDIVVAAVGLVLSFPIALGVAIVVRLESKGPVIYRQERVGYAGRPFILYKFRSMSIDAERDGQARWAQKDDPRVTRVGKFLRAYRLDEIPQLWNVLEGSMSFVGPRPERPVFVEMLRQKIKYYDQRHAIKPGVTGWAQVRFRYGSDEQDTVEKLRHDMFYIKHHGPLFDIRILLETVRVVFMRDMGR